MNTKEIIENMEEEFDTLTYDLSKDIEEQREELVDMPECHGSCECEVGYNDAETWKCIHCSSILIDTDKIKSFIRSHTHSLLSAFAEEVIENFMEDLNFYNSDKPPCTKDSPCGCHFGEVFHADGMCLCDIEERQRRKAKEIISEIEKV